MAEYSRVSNRPGPFARSVLSPKSLSRGDLHDDMSLPLRSDKRELCVSCRLSLNAIAADRCTHNHLARRLFVFR
jgi:hypothetical protein